MSVHHLCQLHRAAALASGMLLMAGVAEAATYTVDITRTSPDGNAPEEEQRTFSGRGTLSVGDDGSSLDALSLSIETLGSIGDEVSAPTVFRFDYVLGDVVSVAGLGGGPVAPDLSGVVIDLASQSSTGGDVTIGGFANSGALTLDFTAGAATGFCFGSSDVLAQCIRSGGGSSGLDAALSAAIVPLPATLPLMAAALGALALRRGPRRRGG